MTARRFETWVWVLAVAVTLSGREAAAQVPLTQPAMGPTSTEAGVVNEAAVVLQELTNGTVTGIPQQLLASAEGIAIVPHYVRGAFVFGIAGGRGVMLRRDAAGQWLAPEFISLGGGSVGWQVGVQATDLVLVFRSTRSLANMTQGKITLGVDASAAAGPVGRHAGAATDATLQAEILTYSRARGLFAGISLGGSSLQLDIPATQRYYQITAASPGVVPPSAVALVGQLNSLSRPMPAAAFEPLPGTAPIDGVAPAVTTGPVPGVDSGREARGRVLARPVAPSAAGDALDAHRAQTVDRLVAAIAALQSKVDAQWQQYLALPASWKTPQLLRASDVHPVLVRYERVATHPQFATLSEQAEFREALQLLRQLSVDAMEREQLSLPPPPPLSP